MGAFTLLARDPQSAARRGRLQTAHGPIETPIFMPVGTQATVKALTPAQVEEVGAQIILANTYHLNLRPGSDLIRQMGGLHRFMGWRRPILTDSGGFQVFSLADLREVRDDGIAFKSHLDGSPIFLNPEKVVEIQDNLGSDIAMVLDECPPADADEAAVAQAVERSVRWAAQCQAEAQRRDMAARGHHLFAIVQGGNFPALRRRCAEELVPLDFPGYAVGGVSVGESEEAMLDQVAATLPFLPQDRPRYVMGVGTPRQLLRMVALGADMFDCVMPTREARHGIAYTTRGRLNLKNSCFRADEGPLDPSLDNYTCRHFSRAYLRHLFLAKEMLAATLLSLHNLHYFLTLMSQARHALEVGNFTTWRQDCETQFEQGRDGLAEAPSSAENGLD